MGAATTAAQIKRSRIVRYRNCPFKIVEAARDRPDSKMKRTAPLDDGDGNLPAATEKKRVVISSPPMVHPSERAPVTAAKPFDDEGAFLALRRFAGATVALPPHEVMLGRPCEADLHGSAKLDVGLTDQAKVVSRTHCTLDAPDVAAGTVELRARGANPCVVLRAAAAAAGASGVVARDAAEQVKVARADGAPTRAMVGDVIVLDGPGLASAGADFALGEHFAYEVVRVPAGGARRAVAAITPHAASAAASCTPAPDEMTQSQGSQQSQASALEAQVEAAEAARASDADAARAREAELQDALSAARAQAATAEARAAASEAAREADAEAACTREREANDALAAARAEKDAAEAARATDAEAARAREDDLRAKLAAAEAAFRDQAPTTADDAMQADEAATTSERPTAATRCRRTATTRRRRSSRQAGALKPYSSRCIRGPCSKTAR